MGTTISIDHDRAFTDGEANDVVARAAKTFAVLAELGGAYDALPGFAKADLEALDTELQTAIAELKDLENQIKPVLATIDVKAGALLPKLQGLYTALKGLLTDDEQFDLLQTIQD
jgi:hypothetical protein